MSYRTSPSFAVGGVQNRVLAPVQPTERMCGAGAVVIRGIGVNQYCYREIWRAMIRAARP